MWLMGNFVSFLVHALNAPLPGWHAQQRMMPRYPDGRVRDFAAPANARQTAVAVLVTDETEPAVLLTLRSTQLRHHRGQISFPGGKIEQGEGPKHAALRELQEEVGIPSSAVEVLGRLSSLYTPPSNSLIVPIVMRCSCRLPFELDTSEVEEAFWLPLGQLLGEACEEEWELPYGRMRVPHWRVHPRVPLWGATAIILAELLELYQQWLMPREIPTVEAVGDLHQAAPEDRSAH